jgi:hypothetical protein
MPDLYDEVDRERLPAEVERMRLSAGEVKRTGRSPHNAVTWLEGDQRRKLVL